MTRVFVSSTCYDLVDLRSEVEVHLREMGFAPVLSESATSHFEVMPDEDSIRSCLVNVEKSDVFICILSQRYGTPLGPAFENVSATHLEYRKAIETSRPTFFYVRDRLGGEFDQWRGTKVEERDKMVFRWSGADGPLLCEFLNERRKLIAGMDRSNWFDVFRHSQELKTLLSRDLKAQSGAAILRRLIDQGKVPFIQARQGMISGGTNLQVRLYVYGGRALSPVVRLPGSVLVEKHIGAEIVPERDPGEAFHVDLTTRNGPAWQFTIEFRTVQGVLVEDTFTVSHYPTRNPQYDIRLTGRKLVDASPYLIEG